jgi:hypothetical protein
LCYNVVMSTSRTRVVASSISALALAAAICIASLVFVARPATAANATSNTLRVGNAISGRSELHSPNGHFRLVAQGDGNLVLYAGTKALWATGTRGRSATLQLNPDGNLVLYTDHRPAWTASTVGSGATYLTLADTGGLGLYASQGLVWSPGYGNGCAANASGPHIFVSISQQQGRVCSGGNQLLITPLTTGASALGDGTPTGTWRINHKIRDTKLFPSDGGVYRVKYWLPYSGNVYGFHDSNWQTIPYGSQQYKTLGSHGCIHLPLPVMAWIFAWAPVGTQVTVHA